MVIANAAAHLDRRQPFNAAALLHQERRRQNHEELHRHFPDGLEDERVHFCAVLPVTVTEVEPPCSSVERYSTLPIASQTSTARNAT